MGNIKFTHKVTFRDSGDWWFARHEGNRLYVSGITTSSGRVGDSPHFYETDANSVEFAYGNLYYDVIKLNQFKGNK